MGKEKMFVSPHFELPISGTSAPFRMMVRAKDMSLKRGCNNFTTAKGVGTVQVKCEASVDCVAPEVSFRLRVGDSKWRGANHSFSSGSVASLPALEDTWNMRGAV